jgi:uncharacterized protein YegP (UPF0339 family)
MIIIMRMVDIIFFSAIGFAVAFVALWLIISLAISHSRNKKYGQKKALDDIEVQQNITESNVVDEKKEEAPVQEAVVAEATTEETANDNVAEDNSQEEAPTEEVQEVVEEAIQEEQTTEEVTESEEKTEEEPQVESPKEETTNEDVSNAEEAALVVDAEEAEKQEEPQEEATVEEEKPEEVQEVVEEPVQEEKPEEAELVVSEEPTKDETNENPVEEAPAEEKVEESQEELPVIEETKSEEETEIPAEDNQEATEEPVQEAVVAEEVQEESVAEEASVEESEEIPAEEVEAEEEEVKAKPKKTVSNKKTAVIPVKKGRTYNGKYEVYQTADGYAYQLKASNGEILVISETYASKDGVMKAIDAVKKNLETGNVKIFSDKRGKYKFKLISKNYRTLAISANYNVEKSAVRASESFKKFALKADIVDIELPDNDASIATPIEITAKPDDKQGGKFVYEDFNGEFSWELRASNGQILCQMEGYTSKKGCMNSIDKFKENVALGTFKCVQDKTGRYQFKLYSQSGRICAVGESYSTKQGAENAANSVVSFTKSSPVVEEKQKK